MSTYPRWLRIAILLVIATVFALNHVAARVAFDHGTSVVTGVVFRSGGTALALLAMLILLRNVELSRLRNLLVPFCRLKLDFLPSPSS